jgi:glycerophosphoryl diester phosphodiesterase
MKGRPLLLGHRGARTVKSIAENTLASFDRALADGCDGFEFDVRLAADGVPVVCHDPKTGGRVIAKTPASQLFELPQLEAVLERYQSSAFLDIELKASGMEKVVLQWLHGHAPQRGFVVSSFLPEVLQAIHELDSDVPLGLICETKQQLSRWRNLPLQYVIPHRTLVRKNLVKEIHAANRKVMVWTVNNPRNMQQLAQWEVDGIISDDTGLLTKTLIRLT